MNEVLVKCLNVSMGYDVLNVYMAAQTLLGGKGKP